MPLARTFSFGDDDEQALSSNEQERLSYQQYHQPSHPQYVDSPNRDIISPPPQYSSPPPRELAVSPPSPESSPSQRRQRQFSDTPPRRPLAAQTHNGAPPPPPPHRASPTRQESYHDQQRDWRPQSLVTPGADNFGYRTDGGGLNTLAHGVANRHPRESGLEALRAIDQSSPPRSYYPEYLDQSSPVRPRDRFQERSSYASNAPLASGAMTPGSVTPDPYSSQHSARSIPLDDYPMGTPAPYHSGYGQYHDSPYQNSSLNLNPAVNEADINPYNIEDDGDDGFMPDPRRKPILGPGRQRSNERFGAGQTAGASARAPAAGLLGGLFSRKTKNQVSSGSYDPVRQGGVNGPSEKAPRSEWLSRQTRGNNRMRWIVGGAIIGVVVLAVIAGIIGGVVSSKHSGGGSGGSGGTDPNSGDNTAAGDTAANGDLGKDSAQIKALLNNPDLHKVFYGIDYTPWGTQYPLCFTYPPSQNNVTRDMAVLSQLTNTVRLYGTDCNQTQMVLHAIDRLELTDMKIWLGVWIDTNETTTNRQIAQMYDILADTKDLSIYKGVIVGNEALYRAGLDKAQSEQQLIEYLTDVKAKFSQLGYDLPVATSDLGDNWNAQLVEVVDLVMSNIHPFFAGTSAEQAASWTYSFWTGHDTPLTEGTSKKQVISETGWPTEGGRDCGGLTGECTGAQLTSTDVAIASVDGLNTFMDTFVCQAMDNGTEYFWFEAFDEPWKIVYDSGDQNWEDHWGLMDPGRNLKDGVKIPDCGGRTVGN